MTFVKDLDARLLQLSPGDFFSLRDGCAGLHAFGGIGSGKTSALGRMVAGAYLRAGFGGLVTAAKPEEIEVWKRYAREHGRERSLIQVLDARRLDRPHAFRRRENGALMRHAGESEGTAAIGRDQMTAGREARRRSGGVHALTFASTAAAAASCSFALSNASARTPM